MREVLSPRTWQVVQADHGVAGIALVEDDDQSLDEISAAFLLLLLALCQEVLATLVDQVLQGGTARMLLGEGIKLRQEAGVIAGEITHLREQLFLRIHLSRLPSGDGALELRPQALIVLMAVDAKLSPSLLQGTQFLRLAELLSGCHQFLHALFLRRLLDLHPGGETLNLDAQCREEGALLAGRFSRWLAQLCP